MFNQAVGPYQEGIQKAGHKGVLTYTPRDNTPKAQPKREPRKRQVTWFNPPWNCMLKENIGKVFSRALEKHFPKGHILHPIFNKHTVKLSYSTMPSMASKIGANNNKLEKDQNNKASVLNSCNCQKSRVCDWKGDCIKPGLVYTCTGRDPITGEEIFNYIGMTGGPPKIRVSNHHSTFKYRSKIKNSTLAKQIWKMKDEGTSYTL